MYRKIRLEADADNLALLRRQLQRITLLRTSLVEILAAEPASWKSLLDDYKLMGRVRAVVDEHPELGEVRFKVLLAYAFDLCNAGRALGRHPERAGNLHRHRECLFYRDGGFRFEGDRLLLVTGAGTLTLKLKSSPGFMVARLRVYRWKRMAITTGRLARCRWSRWKVATAKPHCIDDDLPAGNQQFVPTQPAAGQAGKRAGSVEGFDLETLRAKLGQGNAREARDRPASLSDLEKHDRLAGRVVCRPGRGIAPAVRGSLQLSGQELERRHRLPWLN